MLITQASVVRAQQVGDFNLGSASKSGSNLLSGGQSATIRVAGTNKVVHPGMLLTAAEQVALSQVLSTGHQNIRLNGAGIAVGGQFSIDTGLISASSNLRIPQNVTGYIDFSQQSALSISGNLINRGTLLAFSTNAMSPSGTLSAKNIVNYASISSVLPSTFFAAGQAIPNFNLVLSAVNRITNFGTISSSGALSLIAPNAVVNSSQVINQTIPASLQAQSNLNIITNNIINSGNLTSIAGNVNLQCLSGSTLKINNVGGTISALLGDIKVTNLVSSTLANLELRGGDYISSNLNLFCPAGEVSADLNRVTGWINVEACKANVGAATPNLKLGDLKITGDPTFFNSGGSLTLASLSNTGGFDLALIASHDIIVAGGTIDTTNPSGGNGGNLTIIAGVDFSGGISGAGDTSTLLTLTGPSSTGGAIDLSAVSLINTSGTLTKSNNGGSGGNVFVAAFNGAKNGTLEPGTVNFGTSGVVNTAGGGRGDSNNGNASGNLTVIAGAAADPSAAAAIILPAIFTRTDPSYSQAGVSGGAVSIFTATPVINGTVTVLNGTLGGAGNITNGAQQNASISIASTGGGSNIIVNPTYSQWQLDQMNAALASINAKRALDAPSLPPLKLSPSLSTLAMQQAIYLAQTGHLGHFTVQGGSPVDRARVLGLSSACCAENSGFSSGLTVQGGFDIVNAAMFQESNTPGTHRYNLVGTSANHNNYVGFGFVTVGTDMYFVEEFSRTDPGVAKSSIPSSSLYGGLGAQAGNRAVPPVKAGVNNSLQSVGGTNYLPTSIVAGADIILNAGQKVSLSGSIIANGAAGIQSNTGGSLDAKNGASVSISAGGDISLFNIQSGGGSGATSNSSGLGAGGDGGIVSVTSMNGNISILPSVASCSPCVAVAAQGGAGGQALFPGAVGGDGGKGGSISLSAPNGSISVSSIEAGGGGGGGGAGGLAKGGSGGAGGSGGIVSLSAKNLLVQEYVNASGGGGGGAGGSGLDSGGGGGGAAFGMGGFGGASSSLKAGGGGGGGAQIPGFGGPTSAVNYSLESGGNGSNGSRGKGGNVGIVGAGGTGGAGIGGALSSGGAGGDMGLAGKSVGAASGGASGNGGSINLNGDQVEVLSVVSGFWGKTSVKYGTNSLLAIGPSGTVTVSSTGGLTSSPVLNALADYSSSKATLSVPLGNNFTVGSLAGKNGTAGAISAGPQSNSITINGVGLSNSIERRSFVTAGSAYVTIVENSLPVLFNSNSKATPAELVAIEQVLFEGGQTVVLDSNGTAVGGSITLQSRNIPAAGFSTLVLPPNVSLFDQVDNLSYSESVSIYGTFQYNGSSTLAKLTTPSIVNSNSISSGNSAISLIVQSPLGQKLAVSGNGNFSAGTIRFVGSGGRVIFLSSPQLTANNVYIDARDSVQVFSGQSVSALGANVIVTTGAIFNPQFVGSKNAFNLAPIGTTIGVIANSDGDLVLDKSILVNTNGKNLALLASGNIISSGLASINLSNSKGNGGSLLAIAGVSFTPLTTGQKIDTSSVFDITGVSATGGSINFSNTSINTSSSSKILGADSGGNITLVANSVSGFSAGVVLTGSIDASSSMGKAGSLSIFASGGIVTGKINAQGTYAGGAVSLTSAPAVLSGVEVSNGYLMPISTISSSPVINSGAAVLVNGGIVSSSGMGAAGAISIVAGSNILVAGTINSGARSSAGSVSLNSLSGSIVIGGSIIASGLPGTSSLSPGSAAPVRISVPQFAAINGSIDTSGGKALVSGQNGGSGADINISTSNQDDLLNGFYSGNVSISGYLNSSGGSVFAKNVGVGGNAGTVFLRAGALQIKGFTSAASVLASAGTGPSANGTSGSISIYTYAVQPIPSNFNLLSSAASEYAIPGALFTTGTGSVVNGVSGNLVSGSQSLNKNTAASIYSGTTGNTNISVSVAGGTQSLNIAGSTALIGPGSASKRSKVTPAVALALNQVSLGNKQTLGINAAHQANSLNPQGGGSKISIPAHALPRTFSSFVLESQGNKSGIELDLTGPMPILNIPASSISGTLRFSTSIRASINAPSLTLSSGAVLDAPNSILFSGTRLTNSGIINAAAFEVISPSSSFKFDNLAAGQSNISNLVLPSDFAPSSISIANNFGGKFVTAVSFANVQLSSGLLPRIASVTPGSSTTKATVLNFSLPGATAHLAGVLKSSGSLSINAVSAKLGSVLTPTNLTLDSGSDLSADNGISIKSTGTVFLDGNLSAGLLVGVPLNTQLSASYVQKAGGLSVLAPIISLGASHLISSSGGNLLLTTSSGDLHLGSANTLRANGGNIILLASGNLSGAASNNLVAVSVGTPTKSTGGGIEIGAGSTKSILSSVLSLAAGTVTGTFASFSTVNNSSGTSGVVLSNGTVEVGPSLMNQALLNLSGGAIIFHSQAGKNVQLDGASFSVAAFKPISYTASANVQTKRKMFDSASENKAAAHMFIPAKDGAEVFCLVHEHRLENSAALSLERGEFFLSPEIDVEIATPLANVKCRKGALLGISYIGSMLRVLNCGYSGGVSFDLNGTQVSVDAGEEMIISRTRIGDSDFWNHDNLGRRNIKHHAGARSLYVSSCDVSLFGFLSAAKHLAGLRQPKLEFEKRIQAKILKTATALNIATANRGTYSTKPLYR